MTAATAGSPTRPTANGSDDTRPATESAISVTTEGSTVVIALDCCLDHATGDALVEAAAAAVGTGPSRLDIDLRGLASFTDEGARALVACRGLGSKLPEGLHYRTGRGPGREALLAAYTDDTEALAE
ncbi:MAG: hypothetical protein ACRDZN_10915 [Acidimicrobiales bacterium]